MYQKRKSTVLKSQKKKNFIQIQRAKKNQINLIIFAVHWLRLFMKVQRGLFSSRRKNIRNNLTNFLSNGDLAEQALTKAGLDPKLRAETLPVSSILLLTDILDDIM